jgi:hypothetical protein
MDELFADPATYLRKQRFLFWTQFSEQPPQLFEHPRLMHNYDELLLIRRVLLSTKNWLKTIGPTLKPSDSAK